MLASAFVAPGLPSMAEDCVGCSGDDLTESVSHADIVFEDDVTILDGECDGEFPECGTFACFALGSVKVTSTFAGFVRVRIRNAPGACETPVLLNAGGGSVEYDFAEELECGTLKYFEAYSGLAPACGDNPRTGLMARAQIGCSGCIY